MEEVSVIDGVTSLVFRYGSQIQSDDVVHIIDTVGSEPARV
jgi:hypothetical protein